MINRLRLLKFFGDIRFWIILFFFIRLTGITNPPLETGHNWRQCFTNMIARNFLERDANIFYPQMDMAGDQPGITGSEFPLFNYLIFITDRIFGFAHWYGRLINLLLSTLGAWYFYLLIFRILNRPAAFASTIILLSSIWFSFSRKIMPDTFSVSLMMIGLFYVYQYSVGGKICNLLLFILFSSIGALSKLPSVMFMFLLLLPVFSKRTSSGKKAGLVMAGLTVTGITSLWYAFWVPHLVSIYKNRLYFPVSISQGISELIDYLPQTLEKFYFSSLHSFVAFACFLAGLYLILRKGPSILVWILILLTLLFTIFMVKAGRIFSIHDYYIIPYTPLMALIAGYALNRLIPLFRNILLIIIALEGMANQYQDFFIKDSERYILNLETIADQVSDRNDLVIINVDGNPQEMYFAHRRGWNLPPQRLDEKEVLPELIDRGAKYLFVNLSRGNPELDYSIVYEDEHYTIYDLQNLPD